MKMRLDPIVLAAVQGATRLPSGRRIGGNNPLDAALRALEILHLAESKVMGDGIIFWEATRTMNESARHTSFSDISVWEGADYVELKI